MPNPKNMSGLSDEQQDVVDAMMKHQVFVRAGAGTGKTFTMVEGIVQKLREHLSDDSKKDSNFFDHVFMITFTNNAAAELKTRLRAKLLADEDEEVRKQADYVENAWVSTIHGLCSRILREHALEAGVDPQFEICSASQRYVLLQEACDEVCQKLREDERFTNLFDFFGYKSTSDINESSAPQMALAIAERMSEKIDPMNIQWVPLDKEETKRILSSNPQEIHDTWAAFIDFCENYPEPKDIKKWEGSLNTYQSDFNTYGSMLLDSQSWKRQFFAIANIGMPHGNRFTKFGAKEKYINKIKNLSAEYLVCAISYYYQEPLKAPLYELATIIKHRFDELKQEAGVLDNNDLLERCYEFLEEQRPLDVCGKFRLAIVDEFQDTNELQLKIIELLAHDDTALCFVGDAQQSIYGFRGADLDHYQKVYKKALSQKGASERNIKDSATPNKEKQGESGDVFQLKTNFRSHKHILDFVESISDDPQVIPDFLSLSVPGESHQKKPNSIEKHIQKSLYWGDSRIFLEYTVTKNIGSSKRYLAASNSQIAERIKGIIEDSDGQIKEKDIAVLTTSAKDVDAICRTLNTLGISAMRVNQHIQSVEEYNAIKILLLALANPLDTENAVVPLLMGPLFEVPANDLTLIAGNAYPVSLTDVFRLSSNQVKEVSDENLDLRTYRAFDILSSLRDRAKDMSVSQLVEYVIKQSGWLCRIADDEATRIEKAASIYRVVKILKELVDDQGYGISRAPQLFSLWMREKNGRASLLNSSLTGAVTVETIHQSKGLQYPVVVVAPNVFSSEGSDKLPLMASFNGKTYLTLKPSPSIRQLYHIVANDLSSETGIRVRESFYKHFGSRSIINGYLKLPDIEKDKLPTYKETLAALKPLTARDAYWYIQLVDKSADDEETWRKIYVAMTRAESGLIIGLPQNITKDGPADMGNFVQRFQAVLGLDAEAIPEVASKVLAINKDVDKKIDTEANSKAALKRQHTNAQTAQAAQDAQKSQSFAVAVRKDVFDPMKISSENDYSSSLTLPPFKAYEENETPLPKVPWRAMGNVGSYSSDAHQQALAEAAENITDNTIVGASSSSPGDASCSNNLWQENQNLIERVAGKDAFRFGTAFHALGELAALTRKAPTKEQILAQATLNQLNAEDAAALEKAVNAWWNSSLREEVFALPHLRPEYPFFMEADSQSNYSFTRGFIDLLAHDGKKAIVVDYKTGEQNLTEKEARSRHQLQGEWYARALLNSGFEEVSVKFILVQNEKSGAPLIVDFGTQTTKTLSQHD